MSSNPPHSHRTPNKAPSSSSSGSGEKTSFSGSDPLSTVDARLKHLTENVFPDAPYYLTVPSERPFHLGNRFVSNWAVGKDTVFAPEEDHLQYMTFLSHQDEDTLLVPVGGWADEKGNIMPEEEPAKPTPLPQSGGAQKKKISLSDYKKKASETPMPKSESATPRTKDDVVRQNHELANTEKPKKQDHPSAKENGIPQSADDSHPKKRPNGSAEHKDTKHKTATLSKRKVPEGKETPSPKKRPRLSTDIPPHESDNSEGKSKKATSHVPKLLSPTLPSAEGTTNIPTLLSPTLPADLEEELARYPEESSSSTDRLPNKKAKQSSRQSLGSTEKTGQATGRPHSGSTSSSGGKSPRPKTKSPGPATASRPKDGVAKPSTSSQPPSRPASTNPPTSSAPPTKPLSSSHSQGKALNRPTAPPKRRLMVKLKYGRQNRKRVEALLKFSGKKKTHSDQPSSTKQRAGPDAISSTSTKNEKTPETTSKSIKSREPSSSLKRPKGHEADDLEPAAKRPRSSTAPSISDRPHTPTIQVTKPSPTTASPKDPFASPSKDLKGVSMRRVKSADSENKSHSAISPQSSGPGSAEKPTKSSSRSSDGKASGPPESDRRAWRDEFHKFAALGRSLKHAALRYRGDDTEDNKNSADDKLATATAVESILCFVLAFVADDKFQTLNRQPSDSANWRSIIAYWNVVAKGAVQYPHLHGLCLFLGAISQEAIHSHDLERLSVSALPGEHSPAPTPGSDGNTVTSEESKKYKREFAELKSRLPESYRDANRLWMTGSRELSDDILARQYPNTWSQRSRNFPTRGTEKLKVGKYAGEYFLPLGRAAMPLEAVRFGLAFLQEWCEKEGVSWKPKLTL